MSEHIETILDYNPTEQEWKRFGFEGESDFKKYSHIFINSHDSINYQLGLLYAMRGEKDKANKYWQKVENDEMLKTLWEDF